MAEPDKVLKGLKCCSMYEGEHCKDCPYHDEFDCTAGMSQDALDLIESKQAEIEQMKPIVRCKGCKHFDKSFSYCATRGYCDISSIRHEDDWYCADGERRKEE